MSDQEEYRFQEEEGASSGDTAPEFPESSGEPEEWKDEKKLRKALSKAERKKTGSSTRILLLVLLLVALAGAGVYFFMGVPQPEPPPASPPKVVKKQPIAVPPPPAEKEEKAAEPVAAQEPAVETPEKAEPAAEPAAASESDTAPEETETAVETGTAAMEEAPRAAPVEASVVPESGMSGAYSVQAGAFLLKSHLAGAMQRLAGMGYEPRVEEGQKQVTMTRLRLGVFAPEEAEERMAELSRVSEGVFSLPRGDEVVVYAGSYYNLDKARRFADQVFKQGLRLEEETVQIDVPLYMLSFGDFAERDLAREAAEKAREAGLDAYVAKRG